MIVVISSGHGKKIRGARGNPVPPQLDEVDEARRVVERVCDYLEELAIDVHTLHDDVSTTQSANLDWIVSHHNQFDVEDRLDVSVHFNAYDGVAHGTECLYVTQDKLAAKVSLAIADAGDFTNRGAKYRGDLAFLNGTTGDRGAILIETCFCDNTGDSRLFQQNFDIICKSISDAIAEEQLHDVEKPPKPEQPPAPSGVLFRVKGPCSWFGGPNDNGVTSSEGLAFIYSYDQAKHLFLPEQPEGTTGLARRLNPGLFYVACRWPYDRFSKEQLANPSVQALVYTRKHAFLAWPSDWGPNAETGRVADLSPSLLQALELHTDDEVSVEYPAPEYETEMEV